MDQNTLADHFSLWITLSSFLIAAAIFLIILPGHVMEWETLPVCGGAGRVISDIDGVKWSGRGAGLNYPHESLRLTANP
jgi:hypothetical protein